MDFLESFDGERDLDRETERPLERDLERLRLREREPERGERDLVRRRDLERLQIYKHYIKILFLEYKNAPSALSLYYKTDDSIILYHQNVFGVSLPTQILVVVL